MHFTAPPSGGDQRLDYLADGFAEALMTELGGIPALRLLSPEGYRNALRLLESSVQLDPDFAQGYAALAN